MMFINLLPSILSVFNEIQEKITVSKTGVLLSSVALLLTAAKVIRRQNKAAGKMQSKLQRRQMRKMKWKMRWMMLKNFIKKDDGELGNGAYIFLAILWLGIIVIAGIFWSWTLAGILLIPTIWGVIKILKEDS
jgi:hypothetical protein